MTLEELKEYYKNNILAKNYRVTDGLSRFDDKESFVTIDKLIDDYKIDENSEEIFILFDKDGKEKEVVIVLDDGTSIFHTIKDL